MKVLYLCTYYHRAMIFYDSVESLKKYGYSVDTFNAVVNNAKIDEKYRSIMNENVKHVECFNKYDRFFYRKKQKKIFQSVIKNCNLEKYDLIHSHSLFNGGLVAMLIKEKYNIPYVVSIRNTDMNIFFKIPFFKNIANKIIKNAIGIQFLSSPYKYKCINKYINNKNKIDVNNKSIVIRNGLEKFWLDNINLSKVLSLKNTIKIICVGKVDKNKNVSEVINVSYELIKKGYNIELTIVGQILDKDLFNKIKTINFIKYLNYLKKEELLEVYRDNDIYVMPSKNETFGRVYAEAMTQGLPVIYTKDQGFDGIFKDGEIGYSVPFNNTSYIVECIEKIISNYEAISINCINNVDMFHWNNIASEIDKFYKKIMNGDK